MPLFRRILTACFLCCLLSTQVQAADLSGVIGAAISDVNAYAAATGNAGMQPVGEKRAPLICIDPGHQDHAMPEGEPNGPGAAVQKAKLTSGTAGIVSGKAEYEVVLSIGLLLKEALLSRGYRVLMTRETSDVELSNRERALMANDAGADLFLRLHCNSSTNSAVQGALAYVPGAGNPYLPGDVIEDSSRLASLLLLYQTAETNQTSLGLLTGDDMTGINWAQMPVTILEMGFMSNPEEDLYLSDPAGQAAIVKGIVEGIDAYFAESLDE